MSRYLVVANLTADSPTLLDEVRAILAADAEAEFVVLTPARLPGAMAHFIAGVPNNPWEAARRRAQHTRMRLTSAGAHVAATRVGVFDPLLAIEDELRFGNYQAVIISTLPHPVSHWLRRDLPAQVKQRHPEVVVRHVVAPWQFYTEQIAPQMDVSSPGAPPR